MQRLLIATLALLAAAPAAEARRPVIAYVDEGTSKLAFYDAEIGSQVAAPDVTVPLVGNQRRFTLSHGGRFVAWVDSASKIHLLDRSTGSEVPLPGIDIYTADRPGSLSLSNTGRIAFDKNGNGPAVVYDSMISSFVTTGLGADNKHRQTAISGHGRFLATTCAGGADCISDRGDDSSVFVQNLEARTDTGFPDNVAAAGADKDEEHPCIDGDGSQVGFDVPPTGPDVYLYDRAAGAAVALPSGTNSAEAETYCALDDAADYLSYFRDTTLRLADIRGGTFAPLGSLNANRPVWLTAPYPPPEQGGELTPDTTAPVFEGPVTATNRRFRIGAPALARRAPRGTRFLYALSEEATVTIAVERRAAGRRVGLRCRPPSRRLRSRRRCTRWLARGEFEVRASAGPNSTPFSGRVAGRRLKPGVHRARLTAADAALNRSDERRVRFRVVRR
jgi:hypothetical protein